MSGRIETQDQQDSNSSAESFSFLEGNPCVSSSETSGKIDNRTTKQLPITDESCELNFPVIIPDAKALMMAKTNRFYDFSYIFFNCKTRHRAIVRSRFRCGTVPGCALTPEEVDNLICRVDTEAVVFLHGFLIYRLPDWNALTLIGKTHLSHFMETRRDREPIRSHYQTRKRTRCSSPGAAIGSNHASPRPISSTSAQASHLLVAIHKNGTKVIAPSQNRLARHLGVRQAKISELLSKQSGTFEWNDWVVVRVPVEEYEFLQAAAAEDFVEVV
eukprot:Filipodium_phascolosomae@DN3071_c0_g1_i1.p1